MTTKIQSFSITSTPETLVVDYSINFKEVLDTFRFFITGIMGIGVSAFSVLALIDEFSLTFILVLLMGLFVTVLGIGRMILNIFQPRKSLLFADLKQRKLKARKSVFKTTVFNLDQVHSFHAEYIKGGAFAKIEHASYSIVKITSKQGEVLPLFHVNSNRVFRETEGEINEELNKVTGKIVRTLNEKLC